MFKKIIIALFLVFLLSGTAFAGGHHIIINNNTTVIQSEQQAFDWGSEAVVVLYELPNAEVWIHPSYQYERNETTVLLGGKFYLNRATYQKK